MFREISNYIFGTPGESGFGSSSTAIEVAEANSAFIEGKVFMLTGASSGIGFETLRALSSCKCTIAVVCRSVEKSEATIEKIGSAKCKFIPLGCELSSLVSVRKCAEEFLALGIPLNVLICNAGVGGISYTLSEDGYELCFAVNHLSHFYLANLLTDKLKESSPSRVVSVSSKAQYWHADVPLEKIFEEFTYDGGKNFSSRSSYAFSKLCNLLFIEEFDRRMKASNSDVRSYALHPGVIFTEIFRQAPFVKYMMTLMWPIMKSTSQGAATTVYCATTESLGTDDMSGKYFSDCNQIGYTHPAYGKPEYGSKLWRASQELCDKISEKISGSGSGSESE